MKHLLTAFPQSLLIALAAWIFTGASAQTPIPVSLLRPPTESQRNFVVYNGFLYFTSESNDISGPGLDGRELYRADGSIFNTSISSSRVRNINTAAGQGSDPAGFVEYNGKLYFAATNATNGRELWVTDGTFSGTQLVKDLNAGTVSGNPFGLCVLNGKLYFTATRTGGFVPDLWVSDGTEAGTRLLSDAIGTATGTNVNGIRVAGGQLFYSVSNQHLWATDGTAGGTRLVKGGPANPANPSGPLFFAGISGFVDFNGRLIFRGNAISQGEDETWISDGTEAGTYALEANPGPNASFPSGHTVYNGKVYFNATVPGSSGLWVTDGTQAGTQSVRPGASASELRVSQGRLWFSLNGEPWSIDGSGVAARVKDVNPGSGASSPDGFTAFDGKTYFTADDGTTGRELWASDGTEAGTQRVSNLGEVASTTAMAVLGTRLFFSAKSSFSNSTFELYRLLASDTPPPVSTPIANRTGTVGVSFTQNLTAFTGASYLFPLGYSAAGLPPGITFSGGAGGIVTGNPTTAGVYSVTVSATSVGGFPTGLAFYTITINSAGGGVSIDSQLQLLAPTYNCVSGALTVNPSGGDGSSVEYRVAGLRDWGASSSFTVPPWQSTGVTFTLEARQSGNVVNRMFTSSCDPAGNPALQLLTPTYTCANGALVFNASGGDGSPIEFAAAGLKDWSTDPNGVIELGVRLDPNSQPLTLMARQNGNIVTYTFDFRATCSGARQAAGEPDNGFRVRVMGNPQAGETVDVVIDGAVGESLLLTVQDTRGRVVNEQVIERASASETRTVGLGKTAGMVLLRVRTARQSQTVKIIRP